MYDAIAVEVSQRSKYMHISPCSPCSHCSPISSSILSAHTSQHPTTGFGDGRCARSQRARSPSCGRCSLPSSLTYPNPDEIRQPLQSTPSWTFRIPGNWSPLYRSRPLDVVSHTFHESTSPSVVGVLSVRLVPANVVLNCGATFLFSVLCLTSDTPKV